ncbi:nuclear transport factor 2 family protein [Yinghuangia aomiensis]
MVPGHGGRPAIDWVWAQHEPLISHSHQITNIMIEVDADTAVSESYVIVTLLSPADPGHAAETVARGAATSTDGHAGTASGPSTTAATSSTSRPPRCTTRPWPPSNRTTAPEHATARDPSCANSWAPEPDPPSRSAGQGLGRLRSQPHRRRSRGLADLAHGPSRPCRRARRR